MSSRIRWSLSTHLVVYVIVLLVIGLYAQRFYQEYRDNQISGYWTKSGAYLTSRNGTPRNTLIANFNDGRPFETSYLDDIENIPNLEYLDLSSTQISDDQLKILCRRELPELKMLALNNTIITDSGLQEIDKLESLQSLLLENTSVTDNIIPVICNLRGLKELDVNGTLLSKKGKLELKSRLPLVTIYEQQ
jgi:hypothetical protein